MKNEPQTVEDDLQIINFIKSLQSDHEKIWLWQPKGSSRERRLVHFGVVKQVDILEKRVEIRPFLNGKHFKFEKVTPIFVYSASKKTAYKISLSVSHESFLVHTFPDKINVFESDATMNIIEKDQEKAFIHLRSAPRKQTSESKFIGIIRNNSITQELYPLYDISVGGASFLTPEPGEFEPGTILHLESIEGRELAHKLVAEVMSVRQLDNQEDQFKVGLRFIEKK